MNDTDPRLRQPGSLGMPASFVDSDTNLPGSQAPPRGAALVDIEFRPDEGRFVATLGGDIVGFLVDHDRDGRHVLVHTEVTDGHGGEGIGGALVRSAVDHIRADNAMLVPLCPYVAHWLDEHPDEADLVDRAMLEELS